jgi:hypothetical protein
MNNQQYPNSANEDLSKPVNNSRARRWFPSLSKLGLAAMCCCSLLCPAEGAETFCIDYRYYPDTNNLRIFDFSILDPYCEVDLGIAHRAGKRAYAYISAGEIAGNAQYYQEAVAAGVTFIGQNPYWNSMVVDLNWAWTRYVTNTLAKRAAAKGYDGFFLDTMDSYYLAESSSDAIQEAGLISMVRALKRAYPTKKIITNRGFPVFNSLSNTIDGMLVEGLYYTYPGVPQEPDGTQWLLGNIAPVKAAGKPVYIVDYVDPTVVPVPPTIIAQEISQLGLTPLISPPQLDGTVLAPLPPLRIETFAMRGGIPTLTFTALKGKAYRVQRQSSITAGGWTTIRDVAAPSASSVIEVRDTAVAANGRYFYRVMVL